MTTQSTSNTVQFTTTDDGIGTIVLNRPNAANALNTEMMASLGVLFRQFYVDSAPARCLILTGSGSRIFCAGADLKERNGMSEAQWRQQHAILEQAIRAIHECPIPIIAAVNGAAFAGGLELVLACDFAYASSTARFALTEVTLGIMPGAAGTQNLPRAVGVRRAKEIILTGTPFSAADAESWGVINRVVSADELMPAVRAVAARIAANAPVSVRQAKLALDKAGDLDRASGYQFELEAYGRTIATDDRTEGIAAHNEKRAPTFKGR